MSVILWLNFFIWVRVIRTFLGQLEWNEIVPVMCLAFCRCSVSNEDYNVFKESKLERSYRLNSRCWEKLAKSMELWGWVCLVRMDSWRMRLEWYPNRCLSLGKMSGCFKLKESSRQKPWVAFQKNGCLFLCQRQVRVIRAKWLGSPDLFIQTDLGPSSSSAI